MSFKITSTCAISLWIRPRYSVWKTPINVSHSRLARFPRVPLRFVPACRGSADPRRAPAGTQSFPGDCEERQSAAGCVPRHRSGTDRRRPGDMIVNASCSRHSRPHTFAPLSAKRCRENAPRTAAAAWWSGRSRENVRAFNAVDEASDSSFLID